MRRPVPCPVTVRPGDLSGLAPRLAAVPGRIRDADVTEVRDRARIDEIVGQYVALRRAGGGSLKGLCPFHDERTPSFQVTPGRGLFHCFGCGKGGDVIAFLQEIEGLSFVDAVERLAARSNVTLAYEDGDRPSGARRPAAGQRQRIVEANRAAQRWFAEQLAGSAEAAPARQFLAERGFDQAAAARFGVGYAPRNANAVLDVLRTAGHDGDLLVTAGIAGQGRTGLYCRFRGRLLWPVSELSGDVVGFGARRLHDDDGIEAKYLNTPETPVYRKSHLLYGADLARRDIGRRSQAVVVEGYTDVMAAHLAGVTTAVATCGTSFGEEHAAVLRRLLMDDERMRGEVVFTFDGDAAGRRAAERAFHSTDDMFVGQTYVAVEPGGRDPCDLRLAAGDAAVRELVARRVPLYRFVLQATVADYDLDRADARVDAVRAGAAYLRSVRDRSKRDAYLRELAQLTGTDPDEVRRILDERGPGGAPAQRRRPFDAPADRAGQAGPGERAVPAAAPELTLPPEPRTPRQRVEHELALYAVQAPRMLPSDFDDLDPTTWSDPAFGAVAGLVAAVGGVAAAPDGAAGGEGPVGAGAGRSWVETLRTAAAEPGLDGVVTALAVTDLSPAAGRADGLTARLTEIGIGAKVARLKAVVQRTRPDTDTERYNRLFAELIALEAQRRALRERGLDGQ